MSLCIIEKCTQQASVEGGVCKRCRGGYNYWKRKRPGQRLKRRDNLVMYQNRLVHFFHDQGRAT